MKKISQADLRRSPIRHLAVGALALPAVNPVMRRLLRNATPRWQARLPLTMPSVDYVLETGTRIKLTDPRHDQIARDIYWGGGQPTSRADARVLRFVERMCATPVTFLDIGSYGALFALVAAAANRDTRAIAFEIVPENFQLMIANVLANDAVAQVDARLLGLGPAASEMRVPRALNLTVAASSLSLGSRFDDGVRVPIAPLDTIALPIDRPLVAKLDVEGYEPDVLAGARETLAKHKPAMVCEVLPGSTRHREIEDMLAPLGYRFWLSTEDGFVACDHIEPRRGCRDYVLAVDNRAAEIVAAL